MKIVELCTSPDLGGLELYVRRAARWFMREHIECVTVVAPGGRLAAVLREDGIPYRRLRPRLAWFPLLAAWRLARWLEAERADVLHIHWARDLNLAVLARRLAKRSVRLVYGRQMAITRPKHDWYHRALYRQVDSFIAITRRLQEEARRFLPLPPERVALLYHGVAAPLALAPATCSELRARVGAPAASFLVGLFGRIEPAKGQHVLIEAVALLKEQGIEVHVVLFGHPMQPAFLADLQAQIARLGVERLVNYYGFHPQPQAIMGCFDCIVLTTYNETFGLVLAEAMRAGTAVIGTAAGGVPEIIDDGESGLLVPPGDSAALAAAIARLQSDRALCARLAAAGKAAADVRFDEEQHFAQLLEHLRRIMAS